MLFCTYCSHQFLEDETVSIRDVNGTEEFFHGECFEGWAEEVASAVNLLEDGEAEPVVFFQRIYRGAQVNW